MLLRWVKLPWVAVSAKCSINSRNHTKIYAYVFASIKSFNNRLWQNRYRCSCKAIFFHFDSSVDLDLNTIVYKLNTILPKDISVQEVWVVPSDFHARFSAEKRTYKYFITNKKNPFKDKYAYLIKESLDLVAMNKCADELIKHKDFTSFSKVNTDVKNNICDVFECFWIQKDSNLIFQISANRFLRNMVRAIVGTMIDVGRGKLSFNDFNKIINDKNRSNAGFSVPAKGLFLYEIKYPNWP